MIQSDNMEKPVKFVLPAPNFEKNAPPKSQPHYLTPSGMTLLTREKQPPPMYGPKGSTVPPKFLQNKQQNEEIKPPEEPPKRPFCEACEMELQSAEDFRRHRSQHERCPVDGCKFKGHPNVMDKHVTALHASGLFDKIKKLSTPEEIAAWREERRRKYPTLANAKMRQLAQEQKERRGERLGKSKARFGRVEDRKRARENNNKRDTERTEHPKRKRINENHYKKPKEKGTATTINKKPSESNKQDDRSDVLKATNVEESDDIIVCGIKMFKGTSQLSDYKHEKTKFNKVKNALSMLVGMYGSEDEEDDDNDTESDNSVCPNDEEVSKTVIKNSELQKNDSSLKHVLVELPENHNENPVTDAENTQINQNIKPSELEPLPAENCDAELVKNVTLNRETNPDEIQHKLTFEDIIRKDEDVEVLRTETTDISEQKTNATNYNESSDEGPEEVPIQRITTMPEINIVASIEATNNKQVESIEAKRLRIEQSRKQAQQQRQYNLNIRRRRLRKQNTMLEKLLEPEIRHERNVLLQCVRFVCENNFFGIGGEPVNNEEKNKLETSSTSSI